MKDLREDPFGKYCGNELEYAIAAMDTEDPAYGDIQWTARFEAAFGEKLEVPYAIACNSGTSGLHAALVAAGVQPGDEVIGPALTVVMDAFVTIHVGAIPVFADVDIDTMNIDPADVLRRINDKTRAIIVVALQGLPVDIDPILEIARERDIRVIEDSAQTILATNRGRQSGTMGDIGVYSFENAKHLTSGSEGGMIVTHDEGLAQKARKFAGIGYKHLSATGGRRSLGVATVQDPAYERFDTVGLNYRMTEVGAAIGLGQFERVDALVDRRRACGALFAEAVDACDWMIPQVTPDGYTHSYYTFAVRYEGDHALGVTWKDFYNKYVEMGGDGFYGACKVPYLEPVFRDLEINGRAYGAGLCPRAEALQPKVMQFKTNYRNLTRARQNASILHDCIQFFQERG